LYMGLSILLVFFPAPAFPFAQKNFVSFHRKAGMGTKLAVAVCGHTAAKQCYNSLNHDTIVRIYDFTRFLRESTTPRQKRGLPSAEKG
jgi:hypothetical protein